MTSKFFYLTLDVLSLIFPLAFSFHSKNNFYKDWKLILPALLIPAIIFIAWDQWFTQLGIWGFNPKYICGLYLFNLPIEEILFFICIPYACLFTYYCIHVISPAPKLSPNQTKYATVVFAIALLSIGLLYYNHWYTSFTLIALSAYLLFLLRIAKVQYLAKFYFAYLFILIPFFLVNGLLTGSFISEPVVWYNDAENMAIRMGTIPVEDIFYGMLLIAMNVSVYEHFKKRSPDFHSLETRASSL